MRTDPSKSLPIRKYAQPMVMFSVLLSLFFFITESLLAQNPPVPAPAPGQSQIQSPQRPGIPPPFEPAEFRTLLAAAENDHEKLRLYRRFSTPRYGVPADTLRNWAEELTQLDITEPQKVANYHLLFGHSYNRIQPDSAIHHYNIANKIFVEDDDAIMFLSTATVLSSKHMILEQPLNAEEILLNAIQFSMEYDGEIPSQLLRSIYTNASSMYARVMAYDQAIYMGGIALEYDDSPLTSCITRISLASHLREVGDYGQSRAELKSCIDVESPDSQINMTVRSGLALTSLAEADTSSAISHLEEARTLISGTRNPSIIVTLLSELAQLYIHTGEIAKAGEIAKQIDSLPFPQLPPPAALSKNHYLALYHFHAGNYGEALQFSGEAIRIAEEHQLIPQLDNIHAIRSSIYEAQGDARLALEENRRQIQLNSRIAESVDQREEASARVRYELRMNEANLASAISSQQSTARKFWIALAVSVGLMFVAFVLFRRYRSSRESVQEISEKLTETEHAHKKLQEFIKENNRRRELSQANGDTKPSAHGENGNRAAMGELIQINKQLRISSDSILYVQSDGNYVRIFRKGEQNAPLMERLSLKKCSEMMPPPQFVRIHRSTIVNIDHVERIENESLYLHDGTELKLSRRFKREMAELLS